jgi:hypothetical protein
MKICDENELEAYDLNVQFHPLVNKLKDITRQPEIPMNQ